MTWLENYFWCLAGLFFIVCLRFLWHLRWARRLPSLQDLEGSSSQADHSPAEAMPGVSVVLAARDEAVRIEETVSRLLAQKGVALEIIVVDDRSTDGTGAILHRLSSQEPRLKTLRVDYLPPEWLGKCHACHLGAELATQDWILFTDADCWLKDDGLARAVRVAARSRVDHVTLTPGIVPASLGAAVWHLTFLLTLADWIAGVNRKRPGAFLGLGAFNFVRAAAYRACGGYEALRLTVLDDVKLGLLLRRAGFFTAAFLGGDDAECHWGTTVKEMIRIMEKNYFAALEFRILRVIGLASIGGLLWASALCGPFTGTFAGAGASIALFSWSIPAAVIARRLGWKLTSALLVPLGFVAVIYAVLNSTIKTLRQGGIRWRDTFYPLALLRRGQVR